jgi:dolichol kinase
MDETRRKLVHISGLLFVVLAQFTGKWVAAAYFFMIALTFMVYSEHVRRERWIMHRMFKNIEQKIRDISARLEREDVSRPFIGAFWFHFSCGLTFLIFPLSIASAACVMLAVGDGFSTIIGRAWGRHKIIGKKSLEGTIAMFFFSVAAAVFFVQPAVALIGAAAATVAELIPDVYALEAHKKKGIIDDNLLVPVLGGAVMLAVLML